MSFYMQVKRVESRFDERMRVEPFLFCNNNDDVTIRKLNLMRFHNTRMQQKERRILCWRLLELQWIVKHIQASFKIVHKCERLQWIGPTWTLSRGMTSLCPSKASLWSTPSKPFGSLSSLQKSCLLLIFQSLENVTFLEIILLKKQLTAKKWKLETIYEMDGMVEQDL